MSESRGFAAGFDTRTNLELKLILAARVQVKVAIPTEDNRSIFKPEIEERLLSKIVGHDSNAEYVK